MVDADSVKDDYSFAVHHLHGDPAVPGGDPGGRAGGGGDGDESWGDEWGGNIRPISLRPRTAQK